jgi:hypothetical protein
MICFGFLGFQSDLDLNVDAMIYCLLRTQAENRLEPMQAGFYSTHGLSATEYFSPLRSQAPWRLQGPELHLHGSISDHDFCSTRLPRVAVRYRINPRTQGAALQGRVSERPCQRHSTLVNLRQLRQAFDRHGAPSVCPRPFVDRFRRNGLHLRCHDDQFVSVGIPVGAVSGAQGSDQTAHIARFARCHTHIYSYQRLQDTRGQHLRPIDHRARCLLPARSGLSGFQAAVCHSPVVCFLCKAHQVQHTVQTPLFASCGSRQLKFRLRSKKCADGYLFQLRLSCHLAPRGG